MHVFVYAQRFPVANFKQAATLDVSSQVERDITSVEKLVEIRLQQQSIEWVKPLFIVAYIPRLYMGSYKHWQKRASTYATTIPIFD